VEIVNLVGGDHRSLEQGESFVSEGAPCVVRAAQYSPCITP
jgi:hypothetical protein